MKRLLLQLIASSLLVGTFARASLAAWPFPGENQHERYILSFRSNEDPTHSCKETLFFDNLRLTEILKRRVGSDIAEQHYPKAIARLTGLLQAVQSLPNGQIRSQFLLDVFDPYRLPVYDGASITDLEALGYTNPKTDPLIELIARQSLADSKISVEPLINRIESLNQTLGVAHGVPKAITFIRLSRTYSILEQRNSQSKQRFHQRALARLQEASSTIELIQDPSIRLNMLIVLGRRYAAMGEMATAQTLLDRAIPIFKTIKISDSSRSLNLLTSLSNFQAQLGQFETAWATITLLPGIEAGYAGRDWNRVDLISEMLKSRTPEAVMPFVQQLQAPESKVQALGVVAIAFAKKGQPTQGRKMLEEAISLIPLDQRPTNIAHPFPFDGSPLKKPTLDLQSVFPLLSNYARAGQLESALEIAQSTRSPALVMAIKAIVANEYARKGDIANATRLMNDVKIQISQASQNDTAPVVAAIFSELMENHQYQFAWDMTKAIDTRAWESYLAALGGSAPFVWSFQAQMQDRQAAIIKAAIADKRYDIALEAARNNPNLLLIAAAPGSLKKGLVKEVLSAARRTKPEERAGVLAAIALKLEQIGKLTQAKPIWSEAITAAQQIKNGPERAEALMAVGLKLRQTKHQSDLNKLLLQIIAIDKAYRNDTSYPWNQIIEDKTESSLRYKDPVLAIRLVEAMEPDAHREQNRILLFQNLLSFFDEHIPESETVLAKMPQSVFKVRSQIALADAYFTWGQFQKSSVALKQALTDLRQVQDAEIEKAHRTFSDYSVGDRNTAPWLTKRDSRSSLLGYITLGHTKIQDRHSATQILQSIPNQQIQHQWRSHLACYPHNYQN